MKELLLFFLALCLAFDAFAYDFQSGGIYYNITSSTVPRTVEVTHSSSYYSGSFTIPKVVVNSTISYLVTSIGDSAFYNCTGLTAITFPNSILSVGAYAFYSCSGLDTIPLPNSITTLDNRSFANCSGLTAVEIPNSVTEIRSGAFLDCTALTSVTIPNSAIDMKSYIFYRCSALANIYAYPTTPIDLSSASNIFYGVNTSTCVLHVPLGSTALYQAADEWQNFTNIQEDLCYDVIFTVRDSSGVISGATVSFNGTGYTTNSSGIASVSSYLAGTYNYIVSCTGYYNSSGSVTITTNNIVKNVILTPDPVINIPDTNFKAALISDYDTNSDGEIQQSEAEAVTGTVDVGGISISDLTGIEAFVNTTRLYCDNNQLTSLDVSSNTALTLLDCYSNNLDSLDVSANLALTSLNCYNNNIDSLDVSSNIALSYLSCGNNELTILDVSSNTDLASLYCFSNNLTELDVSNNSSLNCLQCRSNQLTSMNIANGNCSGLTSMNCTSNPDLYYVQIDEGFTVPASGSDGWYYDSGVYFSAIYSVTIHVTDGTNDIQGATVTFDGANFTTDVGGDADVGEYFPGDYGYSVTFTGYFDASDTVTVTNADVNENVILTPDPVINIPDTNFKAALVSDYDTNSDGEIQQSEAEVVTGTIDVGNLDIENLTGIEAFINITRLYCDDNKLDSLDVSSLTLLEYLYCYDNLLKNLKIAGLASLERLRCHNNQLTNLDVSGLVSLTYLTCYSNQLTSLDVSSLSLLEALACNNNQLDSLVTSNSNNLLKFIYCDNNRLSSLEIDGSTSLEILSFTGNMIDSIDVSSLSALYCLRCYSCQLNSLDISNCPSLQELDCHSNQLSSLNIANGYCGSYTTMNCSSNSDLYCVQIDEGYIPPASGSGGWAYDSIVSFCTSCSSYADSVSIEDETFDSTSTECFDALQNITVAENGNPVVFQNGSITRLIAGQSVTFLPGTLIEPGAYLHAYITTDSSFCDIIEESVVIAETLKEKSIEILPDRNTDNNHDNQTMKAFPNPSDGWFTIYIDGFDGISSVIVYNNLGSVVYKSEMGNEITLQLDHLKKGMYFVKTVNITNTLIQRITIK